MNETGLLAYLRDHFHVPPENLATEALAYILNSNDRARAGWMGLARRAQRELPDLTRFITQGVSTDDSGYLILSDGLKGAHVPFSQKSSSMRALPVTNQ